MTIINSKINFIILYNKGKRLNMKKIIQYIASNYRKDKIWLRRNLPSQRNYQVLPYLFFNFINLK